jgi:hypothetical protein
MNEHKLVGKQQVEKCCISGVTHLYWSPMEDRNCPSSRHRMVGVTPGFELVAAQLNIAALPGTTTVS